MAEPRLTLSLLPQTFAICRLTPDAPIPQWATRGGFFAITRTADELSIVCAEHDVPGAVTCERGWRCFKVDGPLDFSLIGVLASLATPLAHVGVSIFAVSTYDTDYIMVRSEDVARAAEALRQAGHRVR